MDDEIEEVETENTAFYDEICGIMHGLPRPGSSLANLEAYIRQGIRGCASTGGRRYYATNGRFAVAGMVDATADEVRTVMESLMDEGFKVTEDLTYARWVVEW
jgi:hypothetical protein